jgi:hypothetical protein
VISDLLSGITVTFSQFSPVLSSSRHHPHHHHYFHFKPKKIHFMIQFYGITNANYTITMVDFVDAAAMKKIGAFCLLE